VTVVVRYPIPRRIGRGRCSSDITVHLKLRSEQFYQGHRDFICVCFDHTPEGFLTQSGQRWVFQHGEGEEGWPRA
jgi:hypothetical protein